MKRSFIRALWGIYDNERRFYLRRAKMDNDIKLLQKNKYNQSWRTYVFGQDNFKFLEDLGIQDLCLVDKKPYVWDMETQQFRHKLEVFRLGAQDFDEFVFLDWDVYPEKPLPNNFWDVLGEKQPIQAIIRGYKKIKAEWRKEDRRKIPCASFVYFREKHIPDEIIKTWENMGSGMSEEIPMGKYLDDRSGGWKGIDYYWDNYEPDFFVLDEGFVYSHEKLKTKNRCFGHLNYRQVAKKL